MQKPKDQPIFFRQSTGLIKDVTLLDAISVNLGASGPGGSVAILGFTTILLPTVAGLNLVVTSMIAFALIIPQIIVYTIMTRRIPRTGADYVWVSRQFGGFLGSILAYTAAGLNYFPYFALLALSFVFAVGSVGVALGNQSFLGLALPGYIQGANPTLQFLVASGVFVAVIALNIVRPKYGYRLVTVFMMAGIASLVFAIATLLYFGRAGVENYVNGLGIANQTYSAIASSYNGPSFDLRTTLSMLPFFELLVFPWFTSGAIVGSELKGKNATSWNAAISALITFILVTSAIGVMYYAGGFRFIDSALSNSNLVNNYSFNFWTLAMGVSGNTYFSWIIGLGWIAWTVGPIAYGVIIISRYLLAEAFDHLLPSKMAYVSPRFASPIVALLVNMVITVALIGVAAFIYGTLVSLYGAIVSPMFFFLCVGLAAAYYSYKREKGGSRTVLFVAGIAMAVFFGYILYTFLSAPSIWGGNAFAYGYVVAAALIGAGAYLTSKWYYGKKGLDISLVFKEIPPE